MSYRIGSSLLVGCLIFSAAVHAEAMQVAITVDDLPAHAELVPGETRLEIAQQFIEIFGRHGLRDVYGFVNSGKVDEDPVTRSSIQAWVDAGLPLGNHTSSHLDLTTHSAAEFMEDVRRGEPLLSEVGAFASAKWFRYPFLHEGDTMPKRQEVRKGLADLGYRVAQVTIDADDYAWNNPYVRCAQKKDQKSIRWLEKSYVRNHLVQLRLARVSAEKIFGHDIPHVLLLHIGTFDAKMLDRLLNAYTKEGVTFVSLAKAQSDPAYALDPAVTSARGDDFLRQLMISRKIKPPRAGVSYFKKLRTICGD